MQLTYTHSRCYGGNPRSGYSGSDDGGTRCRSPSWGHCFEAVVGWRWQEVERCTSTSSTTLILGGMARRSLGVGCMLLDSRRVEALFGIVATSTAGLARSLHRLLRKMVRWKTAAAEHRRMSPCVCWTGLSGLDDVRWYVKSEHVALILTAPFIKCRFVGMTNLSSGRWLPVDPCNSL